MTELAIIDLGYGNVESVRLAFARLGIEATLTCDPGLVETADRLVLPGVGSAGFAMGRLDEAGLVEPLRRRSLPTLGICLGMQLLFEHSEEADTPCLGLIPGQVTSLKSTSSCPVPHMGWSRLETVREGVGLAEGDYVYFAHSYACDDNSSIAARVQHGETVIPAIVRRGPLWGAQFHPERSSQVGANFLAAFVAS